MKIKLNMELSSGQRLIDEFLWDVANPDNSPYEISLQLLAEKIRPSPEDHIQVAQEIMSQIDQYATSLAVDMQRNVEAFISDNEESGGEGADVGSHDSDVQLMLADIPLSS